MDLQYDPSLEYNDTYLYTRELHNNTDLCCVCLTDETKYGNIWDRYELICGHKFHTRCIRRWCGTKQCLNCPLCGDIKMHKTNMWCSCCNKWGHQLWSKDCTEYVDFHKPKSVKEERIRSIKAN